MASERATDGTREGGRERPSPAGTAAPDVAGGSTARAPGEPGAASALVLVLLGLLYACVQVALLVPGLATRPSDFGAFYLPAARAVVAGRSPYSVGGLIVPPLLPFVMTPLALAPDAVARSLWFILGHLFVGLAGLRVWRALGAGRRAAIAVAGAWATSGALFMDLREGQVNALLLLLVVLAIWPPAGRPRLAAGALGAAIALKLWPGILLLVEAVRRRWGVVARAGAVALALVVLPFLLVSALLPGPAAPPRTDFWAGSPGALNGSVPGAVLRLLDPPERGARVPRAWIASHSVETFRMSGLQAALSLGAAIAVLCAGAAALARPARAIAGEDSRALACAAAIALALVAAPVVWPHYHVLQLPGVALLGERFLRRRSWSWLAALAAASLASTWSAPLLAGPYAARFGATVTHPALLWTLTSLTPLGALGILALCVRELRQHADAADARAGRRPTPRD